MTPARTAQIILAAGRSERMGSPKPLLDFDGCSALRLCAGAAAGAGVQLAVIVLGRDAGAIIAAHRPGGFPLEVRWARNEEAGAEQLRSLQIGLEAIAGNELDGFFIHPADHPLATAADYRLLLEAMAGDDSGAPVFIPSHGGRRGHPILCRRALAADFLALARDATARDVIARQRIVHVATPNAGVREDMDTPQDYRRLLELYRARKNEQRIGNRKQGI